MAFEPGILTPIARADGRRTAVDVHDALRRAILSGRIRPGTILSQVALARALDVSRTPVREAMRMLQESSLISSEPNMRSRVLGFDPNDIESLYLKRILLESFGVKLTTQSLDDALRSQLDELIAAIESEDAHVNFLTWQTHHRNLHRLIVSAAGEAFTADLADLELRSVRYQSVYKGEHMPGWWRRGEFEHRAIYDAMIAGDDVRAGELAARHLARTALELLAALAPEHDTSNLRACIKFAIAASKA